MIRSLDKGLRILSYLAAKTGAGPSEIARDLQLGKSTVIRMLQTMEAVGFVKQDVQTGRYGMGTRVLELAHNFLEQEDGIVPPAIDIIRELSAKCRETVGLFVREGDTRVCIYSVQSPLPLRHLVRVGQVRSLFSGATGKIFLAYMLPDEVESLFVRENVDVDRALSLRRELPRIREEGVAFSSGEGQPGTAAVAVPILNGRKEPLAALFVTGPLERLTPARLKEMAEPLAVAAHTISNRIVA
jgi:DNA-binding IclR family transcriptional regulator